MIRPEVLAIVAARCVAWGPPLVTGSLTAYVTATDGKTTMGDTVLLGMVGFCAGGAFPALAVIAPVAYFGKQMADRRPNA